MKKLLLFLITVVYMTLSSGIAMDIHFCKGETGDSKYYAGTAGMCGRCGMKEKKGGCCGNEHKFVKLAGDQEKTTASHYAPSSLSEDKILNACILPHKAILSPEAYIPISCFVNNGPPLYISNCVFRI